MVILVTGGLNLVHQPKVAINEHDERAGQFVFFK
jgi:hypothetical protein